MENKSQDIHCCYHAPAWIATGVSLYSRGQPYESSKPTGAKIERAFEAFHEQIQGEPLVEPESIPLPILPSERGSQRLIIRNQGGPVCDLTVSWFPSRETSLVTSEQKLLNSVEFPDYTSTVLGKTIGKLESVAIEDFPSCVVRCQSDRRSEVFSLIKIEWQEPRGRKSQDKVVYFKANHQSEFACVTFSTLKFPDELPRAFPPAPAPPPAEVRAQANTDLHFSIKN